MYGSYYRYLPALTISNEKPQGLPDSFVSGGKAFKKRTERINWRQVAEADYDRICREVHVD